MLTLLHTLLEGVESFTSRACPCNCLASNSIRGIWSVLIFTLNLQILTILKFDVVTNLVTLSVEMHLKRLHLNCRMHGVVVNLCNLCKSNIPVLAARGGLPGGNSLANVPVSLLVHSLRLGVSGTTMNDFDAVATDKNVEGTLELTTIVRLPNLHLMPCHKPVRYSIYNDWCRLVDKRPESHEA